MLAGGANHRIGFQKSSRPGRGEGFGRLTKGSDHHILPLPHEGTRDILPGKSGSDGDFPVPRCISLPLFDKEHSL